MPSPDADRLVPVVSAGQARALAAGGGALLIRGAPFDMPSLLRVAAVGRQRPGGDRRRAVQRGVRVAERGAGPGDLHAGLFLAFTGATSGW